MTDSLSDASASASLMDGLALRTRELEFGANRFAGAMTNAFARGIADGRRFDDVLKSLALRLSDLAVRLAFRPLARGLASGIDRLFSDLMSSVGGSSAKGVLGGAQKFASGGVLSSPAFFALGGGQTALAGEAGPEAVLPLARGPDGALGVAARGGGAANVTINISTPDVDGFRRSEAYLTGLVARAVARGQRGL